MPKRIMVVTTKQAGPWRPGAELIFDSAAKADKALGEGAYKITGYADGSPYTAPKADAKPAEKGA